MSDERAATSWWVEASTKPRDWFYERARAEQLRLSSLTNDSRANAVGMAHHRKTRKQLRDKETD